MKKKAAGRTKNQFGKNEVRKRAAVMNLTWLVVWLLSFAGMAVFYELKCQAVIGAVYQSNPSAGILVTNHMFMSKINYENLISAASAVYESGYTEQGILWLTWYAGGKGFLLAGIVILAVMGLLSWRYVKKIGGSDVYALLESDKVQIKKCREELEAALRYTKRKEEQVQKFTENIAHQIKTPLAGLSLLLDVPVYVLLDDHKNDSSLTIRREERMTAHVRKNSVEYEFLTPFSSQNFSPKALMIKATLEPHSRDSEIPIVHHSEETLLVVKGTLKVVVGEEMIVLREGDTTIIKEDFPHTCINDDDDYTEVISVITPPIWGTLHFPG